MEADITSIRAEEVWWRIGTPFVLQQERGETWRGARIAWNGPRTCEDVDYYSMDLEYLAKGGKSRLSDRVAQR